MKLKLFILEVLCLSILISINAYSQKKLKIGLDVTGGFGVTTNKMLWHTSGIMHNGKTLNELTFKDKGLNTHGAIALTIELGRFHIGPIVGFRKISTDSLNAEEDRTWKLAPISENLTYYGLQFK